MLTVDQLTFAYPGQTTPYQFTLQVNPGEVAAISGPSGSGKSTLLDLIAGFLSPISGSIALNGQPMTSLSPEDRPVSILFQSDNVFDHLTATQNLALGLPVTRGRTSSSQTFTDALAQMDLAGFEDRRCANLSGGQKQRVALARTLLRDKPVLLLDEPLNGLDDDTSRSIRATLKDLVRSRQWHCLLVTHDEDDIQALADTRFDIKGNELVRTELA